VERTSDPKHGNAYLYRPSFEFLRHLGISRTEDLPEYKKFSDLVRQFMKSYREPDVQAATQAPDTVPSGQ